MTRVSIRPTWTVQDAHGKPLPARLLDLLVQVHALGSLQAACQSLGLSYRHAWELVRQGEAQLGVGLLHMARGKGSTLSALGEKLVWADHRVAARLQPVLDTLASELAAEISGLLEGSPQGVRIHASHGFAIERLVEQLRADGASFEHRYCSTTAAVAALADRTCEVAAFHVPLGFGQDLVTRHYGRWLQDPDLVVLELATRHQGLMLATGNPHKVYGLGDLLRPGIRFINRQAGSGTRFLLEALLAADGYDSARINGFEQGEFTHAAVAACVASGLADAGFGLEPPARQFRLEFIPLARERYLLMTRREHAQRPVLKQLEGIVQGEPFRCQVDALPGYRRATIAAWRPLGDALRELLDAV